MEPYKCNAELTDKFCDLLSKGNRPSTICKALRISKVSFWTWMRDGEIAESGPYKHFHDAVRQAETELEIKTVAQWTALNEKTPDWRSHQALLRDRFASSGWEAPVQKSQVSGHIEHSLTQATIDLTKLSDSQLAEYIALAQRQQELVASTEQPAQHMLEAGEVIDVSPEPN